MSVRHKTDGPHAEIRQALRDQGYSVLDLHRVGGGAPDLLVGGVGRVMVLLEVKSAKGKPSPKQVAWAQAWRGVPVYLVRSVAEATLTIDKVRAAFVRGIRMP